MVLCLQMAAQTWEEIKVGDGKDHWHSQTSAPDPNLNGPSFYLANDADIASGIEMPAVATMKKSADKAYYTLQGVKVLRPTKGIYIHGGKKIVIK